MIEWLQVFNTDTTSLGQERRLLGMDNHGAQQTTHFRFLLASSNIQPAYTPPGNTFIKVHL
jgi:hypothetical protein